MRFNLCEEFSVPSKSAITAPPAAVLKVEVTRLLYSKDRRKAEKALSDSDNNNVSETFRYPPPVAGMSPSIPKPKLSTRDLYNFSAKVAGSGSEPHVRPSQGQ